MHSPFTRIISALLLPLCTLQMSGCTSVRKVPRYEVKTGRVTGVEVVDGRRIRFDDAAYVSADTVYGMLDEVPLRIPVDSVASFFVDNRRYPVARGSADDSWMSEDVHGITYVTGAERRFNPPKGRLVGDSVQGTMSGARVSIPLDSIQRVWVKRTNTGSTVLAVVGVVTAFFVLVGIAASDDDPPRPPRNTNTQSCPFVYSWNGEQYVFDAEPYGGAISRGLERDDYSIMENLVAHDGYYRLLVTNEVPETQKTNLMELWVVDHPSGVRVVPDEWGRLYTLASPVAAHSARDQEGHDLMPWFAETDSRIWESPPQVDRNGALRDEIILTFPKPPNATRAKLVARVGTGLWGSQLIRSMLELRGNQVGEWFASIDTNQAARDSLHAWNAREELYALKIEVEEQSKWRVRGMIPGGGPFATEDRVVVLNVSKVEGDSLRLRIRPPRGFWALNSFAVDYSESQPIRVDTLAPMSATDPVQGDVLPGLLATDGAYYTMPVTGDEARLVFPALAPLTDSAQTRTVLLHSRGYYRLHLPPGGAPDTLTLNRLRDNPGAAIEFAMKQFGSLGLAATNRSN